MHDVIFCYRLFLVHSKVLVVVSFGAKNLKRHTESNYIKNGDNIYYVFVVTIGLLLKSSFVMYAPLAGMSGCRRANIRAPLMSYKPLKSWHNVLTILHFLRDAVGPNSSLPFISIPCYSQDADNI